MLYQFTVIIRLNFTKLWGRVHFVGPYTFMTHLVCSIFTDLE